MLRPPPATTLFPYTTLFRSHEAMPERHEAVLRLLQRQLLPSGEPVLDAVPVADLVLAELPAEENGLAVPERGEVDQPLVEIDRKSTRLNSSHMSISYAVFCL